MAKKKVFLSSPGREIGPYRQAIAEAISKMDMFELIAMETFGARSTKPEEHYLKGIEECDVFVGLVGQRFGSCPEGSGQSHSEIEYEKAKALGKPQLMFVINGKREEDEQSQTPLEVYKQSNFRTRVLAGHLVEFLASPQDASSVLSALVNELHRSLDPVIAEVRATEQASTPPQPSSPETWLLFPFVSNQAGYDTGITIANIGATPFSPNDNHVGSFSVHYYGYIGTAKYNAQHEGPSLMSGEHAVYSLGTGGQVLQAPGFQGYLIAHCRFRAAGFAYMSPEMKPNLTAPSGGCYLATEIFKPK